ncbi:MAG: hypothetical protein JEZ11_17590 [Desulfobacterales bacterium]|nr:hypothetical protein [Desulfobacterales bacterium]
MGNSDIFIEKQELPLVCDNHDCSFQLGSGALVEAVKEYGLVMADCGETVYQGTTCPKCKRTIARAFPRDRLLIDPSKFIAAPIPDARQNLVEQVEDRANHIAGASRLGFHWIPAWDEQAITHGELVAHIRRYKQPQRPHYPPVAMIVTEFERRLEQENRLMAVDDSPETYIRRFYPDVPKYRNILTVLAPGRASVNTTINMIHYEGDSDTEQQIRKRAWIDLFDEVWGISVTQTAQERINLAGFGHLQLGDIENEFYRRIRLATEWDVIEECREKLQWVGGWKALVSSIKNHVDEIIQSACVELMSSWQVEERRSELSSWKDHFEKGMALFIDAPMGLGKSHSIIDALTEKKQLSAVIFMPTNLLCEEMALHLKVRIAIKLGIPWIEYKDKVKDRNFRVEDVYYADGINEDECPHFGAIVKRYRANWAVKGDFCSECVNTQTCRFRSHDKFIRRARIVVTTHKQYDRFYGNRDLQKRLIYGNDGNQHEIDRNLFIIDEDLLMTNCYQPIQLTFEEIAKTCSVIIDFLDEEDGDDKDEMVSLIECLIGKINLCQETSIIPPLVPKFKFSKYLKESWGENIPTIHDLSPDRFDGQDFVGNHLEVIENAIRKGLSVQRYPQAKGGLDSAGGTVKSVFLPNPKEYNLQRMPPHVFFDGTLLDKRLIEHKLRNVKMRTIRYDLKKVRTYKIWQNEYTDFPKYRLRNDMPKIESILDEIFLKRGAEENYFIICSKGLRQYVDQYIKEKYAGFQIVTEHYRNLRGKNSAKHCNVCIVLGSFIPSDAVEIAAGIDFIQEILHKEKYPIKTKDTVWSFQTNKFVRRYKEKYGVVQVFANALRQTEHRQALARTRYIYHDVDFYIFSKDRVADYEPFFRGAKVTPCRADLFKPMPRYKHPDCNKESVKNAAMEWLETHDTVTATEIYNEYGIRRQTVGKFLYSLCVKGILTRIGKTKYGLP